MNNFIENIIDKLKKEIEIEHIEIVDNSHKHLKHKSFSPNKFHLHLKIKSIYLSSISRVKAQKGKGCPKCKDSGFKGRMGIYEILNVTKPIKEAILKISRKQRFHKRTETLFMLWS